MIKLCDNLLKAKKNRICSQYKRSSAFSHGVYNGSWKCKFLNDTWKVKIKNSLQKYLHFNREVSIPPINFFSRDDLLKKIRKAKEALKLFT